MYDQKIYEIHIYIVKVHFPQLKFVIKSYISLNLLKLKYLDLSGCHGTVDDNLKSISTLPKLEILKINDMPNITG